MLQGEGGSEGATRGLGSQRQRRRTFVRALVIVSVTALLASGCGRSDDTAADSDGTTAPEGATTAPSTPTSSDAGPGPGEFGDLGQVCGPAPEGETLEATDVGVTADSIQIGTIADPGFAGRPGLNQEIFDSADTFAQWCNAAGGINGRKIEVKERDAKLTEYQPRIIEACDEGDFMLVGGLGVFDDQGQKERLGCGLPSIGSATNPEAVEADLMVAPVPNDMQSLSMGDMRWIEKEFPEAIQKIGVLAGGVAVTLTAAKRAGEAMEALGWNIVYEEQYNAAGEVSWRPFAEGLRSAGVRGVIWVADPVNLAALLKAMDEIEYHPDFVRAAGNIYDDLLLAEAGPAANGTYMMSQYDPSGKIANLGITSFSSWLLFAEVATACDADLTRDCVWENAKAIAGWTGGGLHAGQDLENGRASQCFVEIEAKDGKWVLPDIDPNEGVFLCDPNNVMDLHGDYGDGAKCENPAFADDPKPSNCSP